MRDPFTITSSMNKKDPCVEDCFAIRVQQDVENPKCGTSTSYFGAGRVSDDDISAILHESAWWEWGEESVLLAEGRQDAQGKMVFDVVLKQLGLLPIQGCDDHEIPKRHISSSDHLEIGFLVPLQHL